MYICISTYIYIYMYIYIHMYTYIYIYIYIVMQSTTLRYYAYQAGVGPAREGKVRKGMGLLVADWRLALWEPITNKSPIANI